MYNREYTPQRKRMTYIFIGFALHPSFCWEKKNVTFSPLTIPVGLQHFLHYIIKQ